MKKLLLGLPLIISIMCNAQEPLTFNGSIEVHKDVKEWLAKISDNASGMVGSGSVMFNSKIFYGNLGTKGEIRYKIILSESGDKVNYEITQFKHYGNPNNKIPLSFGLLTTDEECPYHLKGQRRSWENKIWRELKQAANNEAVRLISDLND